MLLSNWGKYPCIETQLSTPAHMADLTQQVQAAPASIARGLGRCYGDSALHAQRVFSTQRLNHMLAFDAETGLLVAEAGVSLAEIVEAFAPRGWFLPVTPGTKFVTLGGAVASDVHGKNHHVAGTFGQHVPWIDILTAKEGVVRCSPSENTQLFHATCGGHGLTGIIVRVALQLVRISSAWISQTTIKTGNLEEIMDAFETYEHFHYSVAWIDCLKTGAQLGRSILMCGDFSTPADLDAAKAQKPYYLKAKQPLSIPCDFPSLALNTFSVKAFNTLYYGKAPQGTTKNIVSYNTFFYPLDSLSHWNRIYGKRGFTQYQFVIPKEAAKEGLPLILQRIARSGQGSFLAVLKLFGKQFHSYGNISFPTQGYTLALDFPITSKLFPLLDSLDAMVLDYGGRHYLTKDARMQAQTLHASYGSLLEDFLEVKALWNPNNTFTSLQAQRLNIG